MATQQTTQELTVEQKISLLKPVADAIEAKHMDIGETFDEALHTLFNGKEEHDRSLSCIIFSFNLFCF